MSILRDLTKPDPVRSAGPADRIIVVDNTSTDGSADLISGRYCQVVLIENDSNPGLAEGTNVGIRYLLEQEFDLILLLITDAVLEPQYLCVQRFHNDPAQSRQGVD